jgi:hypothetical protein
MAFPLKEYAIESEEGRAILDHKIVQTVLNQAEYLALNNRFWPLKFGPKKLTPEPEPGSRRTNLNSIVA